MKKNILLSVLFIIFCAAILLLSLRGIPGNPTSKDLNYDHWKDNGPLELSPDRGRFALTYSIIEDKSFYFSVDIARFATPDLGFANGNYVSLFAPGVSYIIIPGYLLGKSIGASQVGSFAIIALFALTNVILLRAIAIKLGANKIAATLSSLIFIFATPAFTYAVTLYQHHISTFLILLSIYVLLKWKNVWSLLLVWFLAAASIPIDYPNLFLMFPIALYALGRIIITKVDEEKITVNFKLAAITTIISAAVPLLFFMYFNKMSYGNPFQFSGTIPSVKAIDNEGRPALPNEFGQEKKDTLISPEKQEKSAVRFFNSRNILEGLNTHFVSQDRGIIFYSPVILFSVVGIIFAYRSKMPMYTLFLAIIGVNITLYSMWGDPYGGWAFGSRYLIPTFAIASIFIAIALTHLKKNILFLSLFSIFAIYSIAVNTLGAITSSRIPPKVEALPLEKISGREEKYTYARDIDFLNNNRSKSFVYSTFVGSYLTAWQYYYLITLSIITFFTILITFLIFFEKGKSHDKI